MYAVAGVGLITTFKAGRAEADELADALAQRYDREVHVMERTDDGFKTLWTARPRLDRDEGV